MPILTDLSVRGAQTADGYEKQCVLAATSAKACILTITAEQRRINVVDTSTINREAERMKCQKYGMALLALLMALVLAMPSAQAHRISRRNPYRTFNLSGLNYGSIRWEQQRQRKSTHVRYHQPSRQQPYRLFWRRSR